MARGQTMIKNWTPELKKELNFESSNDGIFYMDFKDYLKFYYTTSICKYQPNNKLNYYYEVETVKDYGVYKFNIKKSKDIWKLVLTVSQISNKFSNEKNYSYAYFQAILTKTVGDQMVFLDGDANRFSFLNIELEKATIGAYYVICKPEWEDMHKWRNIVWGIHLNQVTKMQRVDPQNFSKKIYDKMMSMLQDRLSQGKYYQVPETEDEQKEFE